MTSSRDLQDQRMTEAMAKAEGWPGQQRWFSESFVVIFRTALIMAPVVAWNSAIIGTIDSVMPKKKSLKARLGLEPKVVWKYVYAIVLTLLVLAILWYTPL